MHSNQERLQVSARTVSRYDACVDYFSNTFQFHDVVVPALPEIHNPGHVSYIAHGAEQTHDTGQIVRVGAALQESLAHSVVIGIALIEFNARLAVAQRHRD